MREMTPAKRDSASERDERTSAWLTRAKALYQDKKLEAFLFKPTVCTNASGRGTLADREHSHVSSSITFMLHASCLTRCTPPSMQIRCL